MKCNEMGGGVKTDSDILLGRISAMLRRIKQNGILNVNVQRWFKAPLPNSVLPSATE